MASDNDDEQGGRGREGEGVKASSDGPSCQSTESTRSLQPIRRVLATGGEQHQHYHAA